MKKCKRCGSKNCLLREGREIKCVLCGYLNELIPGPPTIELDGMADLITELLSEDVQKFVSESKAWADRDEVSYTI